MLRCQGILLLVLIACVLENVEAASDLSPVLIWGGNTDGYAEELPSVSPVKYYQFQRIIEATLQNHRLVAFIEEELDTQDFGCLIPHNQKSCFEYLRSVKPTAFYNQVESPSIVLKSMNSNVTEVILNEDFNFDDDNTSSCDIGSINLFYFDQKYAVNKWMTLREHDILIKRITSKSCSETIFLYMSRASWNVLLYRRFRRDNGESDEYEDVEVEEANVNRPDIIMEEEAPVEIPDEDSGTGEMLLKGIEDNGEDDKDDDEELVPEGIEDHGDFDVEKDKDDKAEKEDRPAEIPSEDSGTEEMVPKGIEDHGDFDVEKDKDDKAEKEDRPAEIPSEDSETEETIPKGIEDHGDFDVEKDKDEKAEKEDTPAEIPSEDSGTEETVPKSIEDDEDIEVLEGNDEKPDSIMEEDRPVEIPDEDDDGAIDTNKSDEDVDVEVEEDNEGDKSDEDVEVEEDNEGDKSDEDVDVEEDNEGDEKPDILMDIDEPVEIPPLSTESPDSITKPDVDMNLSDDDEIIEISTPDYIAGEEAASKEPDNDTATEMPPLPAESATLGTMENDDEAGTKVTNQSESTSEGNFHSCRNFALYVVKIEFGKISPGGSLYEKLTLDVKEIICTSISPYNISVIMVVDPVGREIHFDVTELGSSYYEVKNFIMKDTIYYAPEIIVPKRKFSYSCSALTVRNTKQQAIKFTQIQFQVIEDSKNTKAFKFEEAWSCSTFFSIGILSGLFVVSLLIGITSFGVLMLLDISTNDRYDDPNGEGLKIPQD